MNRRLFLSAATGAPLAFAQEFPRSSQFEPTWESLRRHQVPKWYEEAKLGIFIHWGLYSVPAWAPPTGELGKVDWSKWFYQNPYAEWYLNSLRLKESATARHHAETYGADFDYYRFAATFNKEVEKWKPAEWAAVIKQTGAQYAVLTTKHHDGFTLWPSKVPNPKRPAGDGGLSVTRDLVGEFTSAVRGQGLKVGLYYSGGLDWTFETRPVAQMSDLARTAPQSVEYGQYADAHWRELIERYQPSILWNDITYPKSGKLAEIFADYYNRFPDGLVNNRFGVEHADMTTPEYAKYDRITEKKWESCRGLGFSFGYNRIEGPEHVIAADKLMSMLVDIVSKNGNLLLNIGPRPDGSISDIQVDRLQALGRWMRINGEGITGTQPWVRAGSGNVRFTRKGNAVYAFFLERPNTPGEVTIPGVLAAGAESTRVRALGSDRLLTFRQQGRDLAVALPATLPGEHALALKIEPLPYQVVQE